MRKTTHSSDEPYFIHHILLFPFDLLFLVCLPVFFQVNDDVWLKHFCLQGTFIRIPVATNLSILRYDGIKDAIIVVRMMTMLGRKNHISTLISN